MRDTIRIMLVNGEPLSCAAIARAARVSTWLVYAGGAREHIQAAIQRQGQAPVSLAVQDHRAGPASPGSGRSPITSRNFSRTWPRPARACVG
ncbi:hypothetical protein [Streptomyces angustmyceticus]|uniref:hypothetical protein n=1 Tax=Streptomyces angustmyceticus TaxID=285578 RepID=UPI00344E97A7